MSVLKARGLAVSVFALLILALASSAQAKLYRMQKSDFDGDNCADLAVYDTQTGDWYVRQAAGDDAIIVKMNWGFRGTIPLAGRFWVRPAIGAGFSKDLAAFDSQTGNWYIREVAGEQLPMSPIGWGFRGCTPLVGDFDGDRVDDLAVFDGQTGNWYIRTIDGDVLAFGLNWGFRGCTPLVGDFDGDGTTDLAAYDPQTGNWYIRTIGGNVIAFGMNWGFRGAMPLVGDFDFDGAEDVAVYCPQTYKWYFRQVNGDTIATVGMNWGFRGATPVVGDYDGDGEDDIGVYDPQTGNWYIRQIGDNPESDVINWGFRGASPVGSQMAAAHREILTRGEGFLYKPSTTLVLLPSRMKPSGGASAVNRVVIARDPAGTDVMTSLTYTGMFGARPKWRFTGIPGRTFGTNFYVVAFFKDGSLPQPYLIYDGARRQE